MCASRSGLHRIWYFAIGEHFCTNGAAIAYKSILCATQALIIHAIVAIGAPSSSLRSRFFNGAIYEIGGLPYSADDIEHGILRVNAPSPASLVSGQGRQRRGCFDYNSSCGHCYRALCSLVIRHDDMHAT